MLIQNSKLVYVSHVVGLLKDHSSYRDINKNIYIKPLFQLFAYQSVNIRIYWKFLAYIVSMDKIWLMSVANIYSDMHRHAFIFAQFFILPFHIQVSYGNI